MLGYCHPLQRRKRQRQAWLQKNTMLPAIVQPLAIMPWPDRAADAATLDFLALDLETSGLNASCDQILSIGMVTIHNLVLDLATGQELFIEQHAQTNPDSAVINHILPSAVNGKYYTLDEAMEQLLNAMVGRILIAHGSAVEREFIGHYLEQRFGLQNFPLLWLDTLVLERCRLQQRGEDTRFQDLTLSGTRRRHNLPHYQAHAALIDAVATGELFMALLKKLSGQGSGGKNCDRKWVQLGDLFRWV